MIPCIRFMLIFFLSAYSGCTGYELAPLPINHPAHPEAMAAPKRPIFQTLANSATDVPSSAAVAAMSDMGHGPRPSDVPTGQTVEGRGKVIATVPDAGQVVIEHGNIEGFMEAMTMGYRVDAPDLLHGLKSGDRVKFTIDVRKKTIVKIEKVTQ